MCAVARESDHLFMVIPAFRDELIDADGPIGGVVVPRLGMLAGLGKVGGSNEWWWLVSGWASVGYDKKKCYQLKWTGLSRGRDQGINSAVYVG